MSPLIVIELAREFFEAPVPGRLIGPLSVELTVAVRPDGGAEGAWTCVGDVSSVEVSYSISGPRPRSSQFEEQ